MASCLQVLSSATQMATRSSARVIFTGNGTSDILLQNSTGDLVDWMVSSGAVTSGNYLGNFSGWSVAATGDYNATWLWDVEALVWIKVPLRVRVIKELAIGRMSQTSDYRNNERSEPRVQSTPP